MLKRAAVLLKTEPEVIALSFARMADALGNSLLIIILPLYIATQASPLFDLATGPLLGGYLHVKFGFDSAFIVGAAFLVVAMILVQLTVKDNRIAAGCPGR